MTDVPRRSFPLVVAPPGGFEDAVKRGRRLRRRRASGATGTALALVGVLMYTTLDNGAGSRSLEPTTPLPTAEETYAPGGASPTPSAEPSAEPSATVSPAGEQPGSSPDPGQGTRPSSVPEVPSDPVGTTPPPRGEGNPKVYARRNPIRESDPTTTTSTGCTPAIGQVWCAYARVSTPTDNGTDFYELSYTLCRQVDALDGWVDFSRVQEADFSVTYTRGDSNTANDDTVWTYSAGQPVVPASSRTDVPAGNCVTWSTSWNGYDDYGFTPEAGDYVLRARSLGTSDTTLPTRSYDFTVGDQP